MLHRLKATRAENNFRESSRTLMLSTREYDIICLAVAMFVTVEAKLFGGLLVLE